MMEGRDIPILWKLRVMEGSDISILWECTYGGREECFYIVGMCVQWKGGILPCCGNERLMEGAMLPYCGNCVGWKGGIFLYCGKRVMNVSKIYQKYQEISCTGDVQFFLLSRLGKRYE